MAVDRRWPLEVRQQQLLGQLAVLIERGGPWRFLCGPVVAGTPAYYPDVWEQDRTGIARIVGRTLWHAHVAIDAVVEDVRRPALRSRQLLSATQIELVHVNESSAVFALVALGNDDVIGAVAHEVGRAFVGAHLDERHPFRTAESLPEPAIGSLATVYLGLGVVAVNAAYYSRTDGDVAGTYAHYEHGIVRTGGLDMEDLAFVLAVQATVRDDVLPALDTLRPAQAACVAAWLEVLDEREVELKAMLGIADVEPDALSEPARPGEPSPVVTKGEIDEANLHKEYAGQRVFRYSETRSAGAPVLGFMMLCLVPGGILAAVIAALLPAGAREPVGAFIVAIAAGAGIIIGYSFHRPGPFFRCATCRTLVADTATECGFCGGHIVGDVAHPDERLDREEAYEAEARGESQSAATEASGDHRPD